MKKLSIIIMLIITFACAKKPIEFTFKTGTPLWEIAKSYAYAYESSTDRKERIQLATKGIEASENCINKEPKNPACFFFHAVNVGYYYQSKIVGYQKGLSQMAADCARIIEIDPSYAYGGGYRLLGQLYTEVPAVAQKTDGMVRDPDKAIENLKKAISYGPTFPENYIALSKAYLAANRMEEALEATKKALSLLSEWEMHEDIDLWKTEIKKLSKKLKRHIKDLHSRR